MEAPRKLNWVQRTAARVFKLPLNHWKAGRTNSAFNTNASNAGPNEANTPFLPLLRARVRDEVRNAPLADGAIKTIVSETIGTGIVPRPITKTPDIKTELSGLWDEWSSVADFDRVLDIYGLQALIDRSWKESGEVFARMIVVPYDGGEVVPLRIQVLEADMVTLASGKAPGTDHEIRNGIEFDPSGQRVAYWLHKRHPGDFSMFSTPWFTRSFGSFNAETFIRVPAEEMLHIYRPVRPGQLRGVPSQAGALQTISQLDDFDEATLERQKMAAAITYFIQRPAPLESGIDPLTGEAIDVDQVQESTIKPGSAYTLVPGETVETPDLPSLGPEYMPFVKHNARKVSAGSDVPYELLTGDYSDTNDRTVRVALGVFRRKLQQDQWQIIIHQFCRPIWAKFLQVAILNGMTGMALSKVKVTWTPQAWPYINPLQDIQTQTKAVDSGLMSRTGVIMERGDDPEQVDQERADDKRREAALKIGTQAQAAVRG